MTNLVKSRFFLAFALSLASRVNSFAQVKLPALFANNMVLEQHSEAAIWGWAAAGEKISITGSWNNKTVSVVADVSGKWKAKIQTASAGGPFTLSIAASNYIQLNNILLGEVWLCSGQSNMDFRMAPSQTTKWLTGVNDFEHEIASADFPHIRMFTVVQRTSELPETEVDGKWEISNPATVGHFSAVAYYFARKLQEMMHVPIGLIHSSWGGTPAEAWTSKESLEGDDDFKPILDRYNKAKLDYMTAKHVYDEKLRWWNSRSISEAKDSLLKAPDKPPAIKFHQAPSNLYNAMIAPLVPYTIKGVIWYQGESNSSRAYQYRKLFPALIQQWRKDWHTELPFYFVQIAPHFQQGPEIREAQFLTMRSVSNTGMAVIVDAGDSLDIHPRNKKVVGDRLAWWALAKLYGRNHLSYSGPLYRTFSVRGNSIKILFDFSRGLKSSGSILTGFEIAGPDRIFHPALAVIRGRAVVVWGENTAKPIAVRMGWAAFPHVNLYNRAGLPASPFRTDTWKGETEGKN